MMENTTNEQQNKPKNRKLIWGMIIVFLIIIFSGSFFGNGWHKSEVKLIEDKYDSIIKLSQKKQDSLVNEANNSNSIATGWQEIANDLEFRNEQQYETIKRQERVIRNSVDTSFTSNARRIARSVGEYYKKRDSIKRQGN